MAIFPARDRTGSRRPTQERQVDSAFMPRLRTPAALVAAVSVAGLAVGATLAGAPATAAPRPAAVGGPLLDQPGIHTQAKPGAKIGTVQDVGESWVIAVARRHR